MARRHSSDSDQGLEVETPRVKINKENFMKSLEVFDYIRPYKWYFFASLVLVFVSTLSFYAIFYFVGEMIDVAEGKSDLPITVNTVGLILVVVLIIQGIVSFLRVIFTAQVSENGIADVRKDVYQKLISLPITFFEENNSGELISRVSADVSKLYSIFSITLIEFFRQIITLIVGIGFLIWTAPRLSLIMLMTFPVVVLLAMFFGRQIRKLSKERQKLLANSSSILGESVQGIQVVIAFANEDKEVQRYNTTIKDVVVIALKYARARAWFSFFILTVFFGAICFIIYMGAVMLQSGSMTPGELLSFVTFTAMIGGSIAGLGSFTTELFGAVGATDRIKEILGLDPEVIVAQYGKPKDGVAHRAKLSGTIKFDDVHFNDTKRPKLRSWY